MCGGIDARKTVSYRSGEWPAFRFLKGGITTSLSRLGGWPTFRFLKGGIPRAYPAWDLWILRMLARSCISVGTGEDEKEAWSCMSPRLPTFAKTKGAKVATPPLMRPRIPTLASQTKFVFVISTCSSLSSYSGIAAEARRLPGVNFPSPRA